MNYGPVLQKVPVERPPTLLMIHRSEILGGGGALAFQPEVMNGLGKIPEGHAYVEIRDRGRHCERILPFGNLKGFIEGPRVNKRAVMSLYAGIRI